MGHLPLQMFSDLDQEGSQVLHEILWIVRIWVFGRHLSSIRYTTSLGYVSSPVGGEGRGGGWGARKGILVKFGPVCNLNRIVYSPRPAGHLERRIPFPYWYCSFFDLFAYERGQSSFTAVCSWYTSPRFTQSPSLRNMLPPLVKSLVVP